jgi:hypothetical protein
MRTLLSAMLVALVACATSAQTPTPAYRLGRLVVTLRDTVNGATLIRGSVCANITSMDRCAPQRGGNRFAIENLPFHSYDVVAGCGVLRGPYPQAIGRSTVTITDTATTELTLNVSFEGCDMRPFRRVTGTMSGLYVTGFEAGTIALCRPSEWYVASDSRRTTWVDWASERVWDKVKWPKPGKLYVKDENGKQVELEGVDEYFITVHGAFEGPDRYGHMGGAEFHFIVDSVITIRTPTRHDCE